MKNASFSNIKILRNFNKMKKKAVSLPTNTLVILIIAVIVLVLTILFYGMITGQEIFPTLMEKIKTALGLFKDSSSIN